MNDEEFGKMYSDIEWIKRSCSRTEQKLNELEVEAAVSRSRLQMGSALVAFLVSLIVTVGAVLLKGFVG